MGEPWDNELREGEAIPKELRGMDFQNGFDVIAHARRVLPEGDYIGLDTRSPSPIPSLGVAFLSRIYVDNLRRVPPLSTLAGYRCSHCQTYFTQAPKFSRGDDPRGYQVSCVGCNRSFSVVASGEESAE